MQLMNIVANAKRSKLKAFGQGCYTNIVSGAPLPTLIKPIKEYADTLRSSITAYDAFTLPLLNLESVFDDISDDLENHTPEAYPGHWINIGDDEAQLLMSGLVQARSILSNNKPYLSVTSTSGLVYNIYPDPENDKIYCISENNEASLILYKNAEDGKFWLWSKWPSAIAPPVNPQQVQLEGIVYDNVRIATLNDDSTIDSSTIRAQVWRLMSDHDIDDDSITTIADGYREIASQYTDEDTSDYTVEECIDTILEDLEPETSGVVDDAAYESPVVIAQGMAISTTINQVTIEAVDSISNCTFSKWLNNMTTWVANQHKSVVKVVKRMSTAFAQGGFKGVISVILSMMKAQSSITDENGILKFSNNDKLIPKEYIVGLISQIFGAIGTVISTVVAIITPIIGAITGLLGSLVWGIVGSMKKDSNETRASMAMTEGDDDEKAFNLLPYAPMSMLQGEVPVGDFYDTMPFSWYRDYYEMTGSCCYVDVPGGCLFVGPGDFVEREGSKKLSKIRYEFHPYGCALKRSHVRAAVVGKGLTTVTVGNIVYTKLLSREWCYKLWKSIMNDEGHTDLNVANAPNTGVLTESGDIDLRRSVNFCVILFMMWFYQSCFPGKPVSVNNAYFTLFDTGASIPAKRRRMYVDFVEYFSTDQGSTLASWADIIDFCSESCNHYPDGSSQYTNDWKPFWRYGYDPQTQQILSVSNPTLLIDGGWLAYNMSECFDDAENKYLNFGNAVSLPPSPKYAFDAPKYNASTFWLWIGLSTLAVAVVTTAVVVGAVKFSKWKTQQRLKSIASTSSARDDYINATQGVKTTVNEQGEIVQTEFDPSSAEGRQYTQNCLKKYKSSVFKANLKSHIVGGTRFDKTSYYGDATEDSGSSVTDKVQSNFRSVLFGSEEESEEDLTTSSSIQDYSQIITLIAGAA